jgi:hypothetical protein
MQGPLIRHINEDRAGPSDCFALPLARARALPVGLADGVGPVAFGALVLLPLP